MGFFSELFSKSKKTFLEELIAQHGESKVAFAYAMYQLNNSHVSGDNDYTMGIRLLGFAKARVYDTNCQEIINQKGNDLRFTKVINFYKETMILCDSLSQNEINLAKNCHETLFLNRDVSDLDQIRALLQRIDSKLMADVNPSLQMKISAETNYFVAYLGTRIIRSRDVSELNLPYSKEDIDEVQCAIHKFYNS